MNKLNSHIKRILINEYGGSEKKETVILTDNQKYMIKKPDPTRELKRKDILPYQNNAFSEYLGCKIAQSLGFDTQEVSIWEYDTYNKHNEFITKIVCLCKDIRDKKYGETIRDFEKAALGSDSVNNNRKFTFDDMEILIDNLKDAVNMSDEQVSTFKDFYYNVFILDTLIGNTDRHPGNIAIIVDNEDNFKRICPIFDCGSCLSPEIEDEELSHLSIEQIALSVDSAIYERKNDKYSRIRYIDYFDNCNLQVNNALLRVFPKINITQINKIIDNTPYLTEIRKDFYKTSIMFRYEKILVKGLLKIFPLNKNNDIDKNILYQIYLNNIKSINNLPLYIETKIQIQDKTLNLMKISNRFAICVENGICKGIIPIRSNNDEIRQAINSFKNLGVDLTKHYNLEQQKEDIKE